MIKNRHYRALELDKVLQLLSREASCSESQERILSMEPSTGLYEVKLLLQETDDAHNADGAFWQPLLWRATECDQFPAAGSGGRFPVYGGAVKGG